MKKQDLVNCLGSVRMKQDTREQIIQKCINHKEDKKMFTKKKAIFIAAAAVLVIGTAGFASKLYTVTYSGHSTSYPQYNYIPSETELEKSVGFVPEIPLELGGFEYQNATIVHSTRNDEEDGSSVKYEQISLRYKNGDKEIVIFANEDLGFDDKASIDVAANVGGVDIRYSSYISKDVPPDYKLTEEDKQREQNGEISIAYGASKVSERFVQQVFFTVDGVCYDILDNAGEATKDELIDMAADIINSVNQ